MTKILYPSQGTVETNGKVTSLLELGAGFHPDFTGRENIYFNAAIFGLTRNEIDDRLQQIIDFSELGDFIDNPVRTYSSGMYMRLAFSVAINVDADILLIDEILAVGDQHFQDKCFKKLEELRDSDRTIVIVSHNLEVLKGLCNRVVWIYHGNIEMDGDPDYVIKNYLDRIAKDHETKEVKFVEKDQYEGMICIDTPTSFKTLSTGLEQVVVAGWELSDTIYSKVRISIGELTKYAERTERMDVFNVYEDHYGGYSLNKNPGWSAIFDLSHLEKRMHTINVEVLDEKDRLICAKQITIYIK